MISERTVKTLEFTKILYLNSFFASKKHAKDKILKIHAYKNIVKIK